MARVIQLKVIANSESEYDKQTLIYRAFQK